MRAFQIAQNYFTRISYGHKNAISRPDNDAVDRYLRHLVEEANHNGDCIINVGNGYYRPVPGNPVDELELKEYLAKDDSRIRQLSRKTYTMQKTFDNWRKECDVGAQ